MKVKYILLSLLLGAASLANAQKISPISQAMLNAYSEMLKENPKDYTTLYQRAAQYHSLSLYDQALTDVVKAIDYTPDKDHDMLDREYSLLADVCIELKQYENALKAVDQALMQNPESYANLYKKGNICLYLNKPEDAYRAFSAMQRFKSRSQEAYFGMAKADIMMGKTKEAEDLMKEAEQADPSNYITYCRLGDLCMDMKDYDKAAVNYLAAFGIADDTSRPVSSLYNLSEIDYPAVGNAIDYAISKTKNPLSLHFLKGNLAYTSGNYNAAYDSFKSVLASADGKESSVYALMAQTCFALDHMAEASTNASLANQSGDRGDALLVMANVDLAQGNPAGAMVNAAKALKVNPGLAEASVALALADVALDDTKGAMNALNEAIIVDPLNAYPLMARAWINANKLKNEKAAVADYTRVAHLEASAPRQLMMKALAQALSGKKIDADATIEKALADFGHMKEMHYEAAVYYAQTGDLTKARQERDKAVGMGYSNTYNLTRNNQLNLSLAPLRHL